MSIIKIFIKQIKDILKRLLLLLALALNMLLYVSGQDGNPFITHFEPEWIWDNQMFDICQDNHEVMLFANRRGVLTFDSEDWNLIQTPDIPFSLADDSLNGLIYVGGQNYCGYFERQENGNFKFYPILSNEDEPGEITHIMQTDSTIFFYGNRSFIIINKQDFTLESILNPDTTEWFLGIIQHQDKFFINISGDGIYELSDSNFIKIENDDHFIDKEILFSIPFTDSITLIGNSDNNLFLFDGNTFNKFTIADQEYLTESYLVGAKNIDRDKFALSTILGGCLIIDKTDGETLYTINYQTGLPDDEIYSLGIDMNKGLWLSHEYGISRVDLSLPVKNYNTYPGLQGNLIAVTIFNNELYLSTNEGIYHLAEKRDYVEKEVYVKVEEPKKPTEEKVIPKEVISEELEQEQPEKELTKRELRKLKRQQKKEERQIEEEGIEEREKQKPTEGLLSRIAKALEKPVETKRREKIVKLKRPAYIKQKIYDLQSISHEFVKIPGLDEKSHLLVNMNDRILVGTHAGLYEIVNDMVGEIFPDWYIEFIERSHDPQKIYVGTDEKVYRILLKNNLWEIEKEFNEIPVTVYSVCETSENEIWFGCENMAYKITLDADSIIESIPFFFTDRFSEPVKIRNINDKLYFVTALGVYFIDQDTIKQYDLNTLNFETLPQYHFTDCGIFWYTEENKWITLGDTSQTIQEIKNFINLFDEIQSMYIDNFGNLWIIHENANLDKIVSEQVLGYNNIFNLFVTGISNQQGQFYNLTKLEINYKDRTLDFNVTAPFYQKEHSTRYQYFIQGLSNEWSKWSTSSNISFPFIPPGKYTLTIKAQNIFGQISSWKSIKFSIKPPFWQTWWFFSVCGIILILLVILIIKIRVRKLQRDKRILEQKVRERTAEIERQKNEIAAQKEEIMDSIHYAQRIQDAVLPSKTTINKHLPENFILYLPRDIVSGDFYWVTKKDYSVVFAAADCTGHGVPGAFMSMLGVSFLNEIVNRAEKLKANEILNQLRKYVKTTLSQSEESEAKDGMDIALCILNEKTKVLQYSGAFNPLYIIRKNELIEIKANRMPIGVYPGEETAFTNHEIRLSKGDCLYMFSDGYVDQIGGEKGKKFLSKTMKKLLIEIHQEPLIKQKELLHQNIQKWMGKFHQVDDILIIGLRM